MIDLTTSVPTSSRSVPQIGQPQYRTPAWEVCEVADLPLPKRTKSGGHRPARPAVRKSDIKEFETVSDLDLLRSVTEGNNAAWTTFYARFRSLIIACISRVCVRSGVRLQSDDLMDVLGEVCINMVANDYRRLRLYRVDGGCSVSSWIGVIATSSAHDYLRRERRRRLDPMLDSELERVAPPVDGPDTALIDRQQRAFVDEALRGFSKRDRRFVELYFVEAMSPDAIAKEMGVSVSTVYSKKAKIKTRLKNLAKEAA